MVKEIIAKTILHYHKQTFATNWDANVYRGCEHNCQYCFAQYSHKYLEKDFFNDIFVKSNANELLKKELRDKKWKGHPINVCGISDCYQPAESNYKIMPKVIKEFIANKNPLIIMTKSILILRDIDLINELNKVADVRIMISVSTLDEQKRKLIEPKTAPTIERLKMLKEFAKIGCKTSVLFMPVIPYISDDQKNMDEMFKLTKEYNLGTIDSWPLHLHGNTKGFFLSFLKKHHPKLLPKYNKLYDKKGDVSNEYLYKFQTRIQELRDKYNLHSEYEPPKPKTKNDIQLNLFDII